MAVSVLSFLCIALVAGIVAQSNDQHTVNQSSACSAHGVDGQCKPLHRCRYALQQRLRGESPARCSEDASPSVVCCPKPARHNVPGEIANQKCAEFARAYNLLNVSRPVENFIGEDVDLASPRQFPHMALINYGDSASRNDFGCSGSLISPLFVLSAAHCLRDKNDRAARWVLLGDLDLSTDLDDARPEVVGIAVSHTYRGYSPPARYGDAVLFQLERRATLSAFVWPTCLWAQHDALPDAQAITTSWGWNSHFNGRASDVLKIGRMSPITPAECERTLNATSDVTSDVTVFPRGLDSQSQLCAAEGQSDDFLGENDTVLCRGDGGAPLQAVTTGDARFGGMFRTFGVASFSRGAIGGVCGPIVFTRVSAILPWIERVVWRAAAA